MVGQSETGKSLSPASVEALFHTYSQKLFKYACRLAHGHTQDAEDLLIETFVCLSQNACAPIEEMKDPYRYLSRIMNNVYLTERRRRHAQRRRAELAAGCVDLEQLVVIDPIDVQQQQQQQDLILHACHYALTHLRSSNRGRMLLLRYFLGYSAREIARILGTTINTVDKTLSQARAEVRELLAATGRGLSETKRSLPDR